MCNKLTEDLRSLRSLNDFRTKNAKFLSNINAIVAYVNSSLHNVSTVFNIHFFICFVFVLGEELAIFSYSCKSEVK